MIVQSFGSGSSGNATLIEAGDIRVLIDCGLGPRLLRRALKERGTALDQIDAVLITHEHDDHVRGLAAVCASDRRIHTTPGTGQALGLSTRANVHISFAEAVEIGHVSVIALPTSHDAAEPCGFSLFDGSIRFTMLTDLGVTDDRCLEIVAQSDLIVIEANHDLHMLRSGPYPEHLKRRVASARGHLSNADCGEFLKRALANERSARTIWLAHLSATNNRPDLAVKTVELALTPLPIKHLVSALPRRESGPVWSPVNRPLTAQLGLFEHPGRG